MATGDFFYRVDPEFKHRLYKSVSEETLKFCYQCGSCTASCPISRFTNIYRPNKILHLAKLGIRNLPFGNAVLLCSACTSCTKGCPQGVRVHEVMNALKELSVEDGLAQHFLTHGFEQTLLELSDQIPFPVTYSWIALRPCAEKAANGGFDSQVMDVLRGWLSRKPKAPKVSADKDAVAIIGSGPAGLTAAWSLARMGVPVTVFETFSEPGGMLKVGIPEYRLPKEVVDAEIKQIKDLGVAIQTNVKIDRALFDSLVSGGQYKAVFLSTGSHTNRKLRVEGESLQGVVPALELLREYNLNGSANIGKNVVVIGGGNVAMDAARAALYCGAQTVRLFCLESRAEMPAHKWEIEEAAAEGIELNPSWGPKAILGDAKVTGVEFIRCKSVFDENRKFSPKFDEKTTQTIEADTVISAIGQSSDLGYLTDRVETVRGVVVVDPYTMETSIPGVFAGGDAAPTSTGSASVIDAMVAGRVAASSILRYLQNTDAVGAVSERKAEIAT